MQSQMPHAIPVSFGRDPPFDDASIRQSTLALCRSPTININTNMFLHTAEGTCSVAATTLVFFLLHPFFHIRNDFPIDTVFTKTRDDRSNNRVYVRCCMFAGTTYAYTQRTPDPDSPGVHIMSCVFLLCFLLFFVFYRSRFLPSLPFLFLFLLIVFSLSLSDQRRREGRRGGRNANRMGAREKPTARGGGRGARVQPARTLQTTVWRIRVGRTSTRTPGPFSADSCLQSGVNRTTFSTSASRNCSIKYRTLSILRRSCAETCPNSDVFIFTPPKASASSASSP